MLCRYLFFLLMIFIGSNAAPMNDTDTYVMLPLCKRDNPELGECIKNVTELLRERVKTGIPELKLPSLEPLKIPTVKLEQNNDELSYKAVLMDIEVHGLSNYEFTEIEADMENYTIMATAKFDHLYVDSEYMLMGKFQMLPVEGSGRLMVNFTDTMIHIKIQGALVKRRENYHFMSQDTEVNVDVGNSNANFENLYSGDGEKSLISEHLINMHSDEILLKLKPSIETVLSMVLDDVANKFYKAIPFDNLFPV